MSDDAVNESRADWKGSDDKKPPIMGKQQPIRSYMEDAANWALRKGAPDEKCGALGHTRGLSKRPFLMDLGKKLPRDKLRHSDGLWFLCGLLQKVRRFAELVKYSRKEGAYMEEFEAKRRKSGRMGLSR